MGTLYDALDVAAIPKTATIVAGYIDGNWPTFDAVVAAFPQAEHVSIATGATGGAGARVADCETGDFTPQTAAGWAKAEIAAGRRPTIYYQRSSAPAVAQALRDAGVALSAVDYWVADWTGTAHLVKGSVATQWASPSTGSGGNFDISETDGIWPAEPPPPPVPPTNTEEENMVHYQAGGQDHIVVYESGRNRTVHYWQNTPTGAPGVDSTWHSEVLTEPA